MNIFKIIGISLTLCSFMVLNAQSSFAAPKPKKPAKVSAPAITAVKWEYCYVASGTYINQDQGITAYFPNGRQRFIAFNASPYNAIVKMLNELGSQGWHVVGSHGEGGPETGIRSWTFERRK